MFPENKSMSIHILFKYFKALESDIINLFIDEVINWLQLTKT